MGTQRIRILIVDDQRLLCESFRKLIEMESDFKVVGTAADGEEALELAQKLYIQQELPDVVLMDVRMPRMDGIAATRIFKERWPAISIVILTTFDDIELIHAGLQAGAVGYLLKDTTAKQPITTINAAVQGQVLLHQDIANKVIAFLSPSPTTPTREETGDLTRLTEREREVLILLAHGASNREISDKLYITGGTVKNHLSSILSKLGVRDRTQAALKAREFGLI
jgi:DNA-binding NarL/FixJ family response regulator